MRSVGCCSHLCGLTADDTSSLSRHLFSPISHQGEVVAAAKIFLQEERGATAAQLAVGDDGNAVT